MKVFLNDVGTAIKTMSKSAWVIMKTILIGVACLTAAISAVGLVVLALHEYLWQTIVVMVMIALTIWFLIELETARFARQKEEEDRQSREGKK
jgi:Ca2+/Na+ antiporter